MSESSLYDRLGGYDGNNTAAIELLRRLMNDAQLGRFWQNRGKDGLDRERQLLIDYLCAAAGGPMYYTGRDMKLTHVGMGISESDWSIFMGHVSDTLDSLGAGERETGDVLGFVESLKGDIID
jgi:hemoglobin